MSQKGFEIIIFCKSFLLASFF